MPNRRDGKFEQLETAIRSQYGTKPIAAVIIQQMGGFETLYQSPCRVNLHLQELFALVARLRCQINGCSPLLSCFIRHPTSDHSARKGRTSDLSQTSRRSFDGLYEPWIPVQNATFTRKGKTGHFNSIEVVKFQTSVSLLPNSVAFVVHYACESEPHRGMGKRDVVQKQA